ncbi:hypothetical protein F2Q69_00013859 [Brassica cretica]|uniref:Uncharacterized protein n=1 Tax=Brassica cretica TaxID=69181 RepID=A0A8S9QUW1_BRACR|nr:hypothetical protein F2Q69_00013859 [Brassica cretica]
MTYYPADKTTEDRSRSPLRSSFPRRDRAHVPTGNKDLEFCTRVDRHGNTFGTRVSTKHTRNSPPEDSSHSSSLRLRTERKDRNESTRSVEITSPQYVHTRERNQRSSAHARTSSLQKEMKQWREKQPKDSHNRHEMPPPHREDTTPAQVALQPTIPTLIDNGFDPFSSMVYRYLEQAPEMTIELDHRSILE